MSRRRRERIPAEPAPTEATPDPVEDTPDVTRPQMEPYRPAATFEALLSRLAPSTRAAIDAAVAAAPELPDDENLRRVFDGAGARILARRRAENAA